MKKILALITVLCFVANSVSFGLVNRPPSTGAVNRGRLNSLAAALKSDPDILGKNPSARQRYDITRVNYQLLTILQAIAKEMHFTLLTLKDLLLLRGTLAGFLAGKNIAPQHKDMHTFVEEIVPFGADGIRVMTRVLRDDKPETYFTVVKPGEGEELSLDTYTSKEFLYRDGFEAGLPERKPEDAAAIARDRRHEEGVDELIRLAHEWGIAMKPLENRFNYHVEAVNLMDDLNLQVTTPADLIPIEDREFWVIDKGALCKKYAEVYNLSLEAAKTEIDNKLKTAVTVAVRDDNSSFLRYKEIEGVTCNMHSSNRSIHMITVDPRFIGYLTDQNFLSASGLEIAEKIYVIGPIKDHILKELAYEFGVIVGQMPFITEAQLRTIQAEFSHMWPSVYAYRNDASGRFTDWVESGAKPKTPVEATVVDLRGLETRDFAAGETVFLAHTWPLSQEEVRAIAALAKSGVENIFFNKQKLDKETIENLALADEVGVAIATPVEKYTIFTAYNLHRNKKELEQDRNDRFDIVRIPTTIPEKIVAWVLWEMKRQNIEPKNAVVQLPAYFSQPDYTADLKELADRGIRFMIIDINELTFVEDDTQRAEYRANVLAMLLLVRNVTDENSSAYRLLRYYVQGHLARHNDIVGDFSEQTISMCLAGIITNAPIILREFVFYFKPVGKFETRPYRLITAALRSA